MSTLNHFDLTGEIAIITGGCGKLGSDYARALLDAGARVALIDVQPESASFLEADARRGGLLAVRADITDKAQVDAAFAAILGKLGAPSILINNGGIDVPPDAPITENGPFEDYPETSWDCVMRSHLRGAFLASQAFIRAVRAGGRDRASIINISSIYGLVSPDQSLYQYRRDRGEMFFKPVAYSVAKSGMLNLTRWLAEYGAPLGIRANTLVLGGVASGQDETFIEEYGKRTMAGRLAQRGEYNGAVLFLASYPHSSYMTGATLVLDGGWTAR